MVDHIRGRRFFAAVLVLVTVLGLSGCVMKGAVVDAGGVTFQEAEKMSGKQQFGLFMERRVEMESLLTEAQLQVSDGEWKWLSRLTIPQGGEQSPYPLEGTTGDDSYFMEIARSINLQSTTGTVADTEKIVAYFKSKSWKPEVTDDGGGEFTVTADIDHKYWLEFSSWGLGKHTNMIVYSYPFWGDYHKLLAAVGDRVLSDDIPGGPSKPGVYPQHPKWEDPVVVEY